jgi:hypothetical protein
MQVETKRHDLIYVMYSTSVFCVQGLCTAIWNQRTCCFGPTDTSSWQISIYPSWLPPDLRCDFCKSSTSQHVFLFNFLPLRWFSKPWLVLSLQWKTTSSWNLSGNRVNVLAHWDFSMGIFIGSWSPMILCWLFCVQHQESLSSCGAYLEVVFEFEWIATYFSLLRAALILVPPHMPKWVWPLINCYIMFFI